MENIFGLEKKLVDQLKLLKEEFNLQSIKAEFETEGSSFRDLVRLRRITGKLGVALYLKIGGVEAVRDIKDSLEAGVDGLVAPMVESRFGLKKFFDAVDSIYKNKDIHLSINIETQQAVANLDSILELGVEGNLDNVTVGRTDLSQSYFDPMIQPDSLFIFDLIENLSFKTQASRLTLTIGGSVKKRVFTYFSNE
ncbi:aldolase/citrate lyase family protein [Nitrospinae bacterium]|nr:aldolase/citrate lyase family protein [Nitrospinota bacterium]